MTPTIRHGSLLTTAALLAACASAPAPDKPFEPPVYPPPPAEARFVYEATLRSSTQVTLDREQSRWRYLLTGERPQGVAFAKPFDVAVCQGRVFVSDTVRRQVLVFDFPGARFFEIGLKDPGRLLKPLGLATDAACNLYVADGTQSRVLVYDQEGTYQRALGGTSQFHRLSHVAVDPEGRRLFAVDTGGVTTDEHRVRVLDARSGESLRDFGVRGKDAGQLNLPRDIAVAPNGDVYIVDSGNFRVQVFRPDGTFVREFGSPGAQFGQFSRPKGIAVDRDGNVYVVDTAFGNFQIFDAQGRLLMFVGERSAADGPGKFMLPAGIEVDEDGRVYFVDQFFAKVEVFRPVSLAPDAGYFAARRQSSQSK